MKYYQIYACRPNKYTYTKLGEDNCFKSLDEAVNQVHKLYNEWIQYGWAFVIVEEG